MEENTKIAILLSVYNGEKYISEQIHSLVRQTVHNNMTLYIRDDGSSDKTIDIINQWREKIDIVIYQGLNIGPARSFWELLKMNIDADYYLFCDQDDIWDCDKVEKSIEAITENICLSYCNCRYIDSNGQIIKEKRLQKRPNESYENLFISGVTQGCSMCFTKSLKDFIMSKTIECIPMHDIVVMLYAKSMGDLVWIDEPLFSYRIHDNNVVAKNGNPFVKLRNSLRNWRNSRNNSMSNVAAELLNNFPNLYCYSFLVNMSLYKTKIASKSKILNNKELKNVTADCKRSYICRILLNWL